jgi:hypothetical protein
MWLQSGFFDIAAMRGNPTSHRRAAEVNTGPKAQLTRLPSCCICMFCVAFGVLPLIRANAKPRSERLGGRLSHGRVPPLLLRGCVASPAASQSHCVHPCGSLRGHGLRSWFVSPSLGRPAVPERLSELSASGTARAYCAQNSSSSPQQSGAPPLHVAYAHVRAAHEDAAA